MQGFAGVPGPPSGGKFQVSTAGGADPAWRRDGRELFYLAEDGKLMAVEVKLAPKFEAGVPRALFETPVRSNPRSIRNWYTVAADSQRFLFNIPAEQMTLAPITVVVNWDRAGPTAQR